MSILDATEFSIDFFYELSHLIEANAKVRREFALVTQRDRPVLSGKIDSQRLLAILEGVEKNVQKEDPHFALSPTIARIGEAFTPRHVSAWVLQISLSGPGKIVHGHEGVKMTIRHYGRCWTCLALLFAGPVKSFFRKLDNR